jgi:hypothetical protein
MRRAYRVLHEGDEVGYLGEGPGPLLLAARSRLPARRLSHARFTSLDAGQESAVVDVITASRGFESALEALHGRGFLLQPVAYADVFVPEPA